MFKSPVPIFLREEMNNSNNDHPSFVILNGTEKELLTDHTQFYKLENPDGKINRR